MLTRIVFLAVVISSFTPIRAQVSPGASGEPSESTEERLRRLEALVSSVVDENRRLSEQNKGLEKKNEELESRYKELSKRYEAMDRRLTDPKKPATPQAPDPSLPSTDSKGSTSGGKDQGDSDKETEHDGNNKSKGESVAGGSWPEMKPMKPTAGYDRGFFIQADDLEKTPFRMVVNFENEFRYTGLARVNDFFINAAGDREDVPARNDFEVNRGRLIFRGFAIDPKLSYNLTFDYSTLRDDRFAFLQGWLTYKFSDRLELSFGQGKVPGSREWLARFWEPQGADRSMATTFFRPSRTTALWIEGEPTPGLFYELLWGNGFNTGPSGLRGLDTNFSYSGSIWWEPLGEFGLFYSDIQDHEDPVTRFGTSFVNARQSSEQGLSRAPENAAIRLSDGTLLTTPGALAPGVELLDYSIYLSSIDAALKYRGFSISGEYFLRWLQGFRTTMPLPEDRRNLFDHGFFAQAGYFVLPKRVELYTRFSYIEGPFGHGSEAGGGLNWFIRGLENWRLTLDVTKLNSSPAEQIRTGYEAGASGVLFRAQLQTRF